MKRRKFATAAAFLAALLVAALAAASVSAATSSHKSAAVSGKGWSKGPGHSHGGKQTPKLAGTGQFTPTAPSPSHFIGTKGNYQGLPENHAAILSHDRQIPGKHGPNGQSGPQSAASPGAPFIPHAHSLPITSANYSGSKPGLNAYSQDAFGAGPGDGGRLGGR